MILDAYDKIHPILKPVKGLVGQLSCVAPTPVDDALDADSPHPVQNAVVTAALNEKVDAIDGKSLSSNDFTDAYKAKLDGIQAQANKTVVDALFVANSTNPVQSKTIKLALDGKVDKEDGKVLSDYNFTSGLKAKLEGIEAGATKTIIDTSMVAASPNAVSNSAVCAALENKVSVVPGKGLSSNDFTDELKEKLENLDPSSGGGSVNDVTVAGTSVLDGDTAKIPKARSNVFGVVEIKSTAATPSAAGYGEIVFAQEQAGQEMSASLYTPIMSPQKVIDTKNLPAASSSSAGITMVDTSIVSGGTNPVTGGSIYTALAGKASLVGTELEANTNLNDLGNGVYYTHSNSVIDSLVNSPIGSHAGTFGMTLICFGGVGSSGQGYQFQIAYDNALLVQSKPNVFVRRAAGDGTYTNSAWRRLMYSDEITIGTSIVSGGTDPVTGGAIYTALSGKLDTSSYVIDSALDDTSTNPLENAAIFNAFAGVEYSLADKISLPESPSDGDVLTWDDTEGAWVAAAPTGGGGGVLGVTQDQDGYLVLSPVSAVTEEDVSDTGAVTAALDPNVLYHFTGSLTSLTITLNTPQTGMIAHYHFDFESGATAATLTLPNTVVMPSGFSVAANTRYEVDILNTYACVQSWAVSS